MHVYLYSFSSMQRGWYITANNTSICLVNCTKQERKRTYISNQETAPFYLMES